MRALSTLALTRPPGAAFEYSNANYLLLGLLIEAASAESFADYVRERIFRPLGMDHTYTSLAEAKQQGLAVGHRYWFGMPVAEPNLPVPVGSLRANLIISCAEDIARYLIALLNDGRYGDAQIVSCAGIAELWRPAAEFGPAGLGPLERLVAKGVSFGQYGMGWNVDRIGQTTIISHGGTMPDYGATMALVPEQGKGLVLLFNANHHMMVPVLAEFEAGLAALLAGEQPAPMPAVRAIPWALRGQLLIPLLQLAGIATTLQQLRRRQREPAPRPSGRRATGRHLGLPVMLHLLVGLGLRPLLGKRRGYVRLYMPDFALTAVISTGLAVEWSILRTGQVPGTRRQGAAAQDSDKRTRGRKSE
jgi:CubicO group peptidase (beta-lactamase class C family)